MALQFMRSVDQSGSRLLSLAGELRNQIYAHYLDSAIFDKGKVVPPAIIGTCVILRREVLSLLGLDPLSYRLDDRRESQRTWLAALHQTPSVVLTSVCIHVDDFDMDDWFTGDICLNLKDHLPQLRDVQFIIHISHSWLEEFEKGVQEGIDGYGMDHRLNPAHALKHATNLKQSLTPDMTVTYRAPYEDTHKAIIECLGRMASYYAARAENELHISSIPWWHLQRRRLLLLVKMFKEPGLVLDSIPFENTGYWEPATECDERLWQGVE